MKNTLLLLAIALVVPMPGCMVTVKENDPNDPHHQPPPPPPPPPPGQPAKQASDSYRLRYNKNVDAVYEGIKKAFGRLGVKEVDRHTPGTDNWTVKGNHNYGYFEVHIYMNRHDHRTRTTVTVTSLRYDQMRCREWTRRVHAEIGKQIGEDGKE